MRIPDRVPLLLLALLVVIVAACGERERPEPEVELNGPMEAAVNDDIIGTWVLTEQAGAAPDRLVTVTFTTTGHYIILTEGRAGQRHFYELAGDDLITVSDSLGGQIEQYVYEVSARSLTLTVPGTEVSTVLERRPDLLNERPDLVPPVDTDPHPDAVRPMPPPPDDVPAREDVGAPTNGADG